MSDGPDGQAADLSRRSLLAGVGASMAAAPALVGSASGTDASGAIGQGPQGVHLAYGFDPASMMTISWTGRLLGGAAVRYGDPGDLDTTVYPEDAPVPGLDGGVYTARLTGLAPDTEYAYEIDLNGERKRGRFRTAPGRDRPDDHGGSTDAPAATSDTNSGRFRVTAVGDHGIADPTNVVQRADTKDPNKVVELARSRDPAFHIIPGDIAYANGVPGTWEQYFETFEGFYGETPLMTVPGNHEAEPGTGLLQYDRRLNDAMPTYDPGLNIEAKQRWYHFVYENALFMGLNTTADACGDIGRGEEYIPLYDPRCETEAGLTYGEIQGEYISETLAWADEQPHIDWKVVFFHGPLWTTSPDHAPRRDLRKRWGAHFDEYDVDLVLSGDNHVYERTRPIVNADAGAYMRAVENGDDPPEIDWTHGTTYVTNGTGGTSHYELGPPEEFLAVQDGDHFGVTELDVGAESIDVRYVAMPPIGDRDPADVDPQETATVVDEFSIVKDEQGRPTQATLVDRAEPTPSLSVSGERRDDGTVFQPGGTNQVTLAVTGANDAVEVRDLVPDSWTVTTDDEGVPYGDATRVTSGPGGGQYVYFGDAASRSTVRYFVRAPDELGGGGPATFGPFEARGTDRFADSDWQAVSGTESTEVTVGLPGSGL